MTYIEEATDCEPWLAGGEAVATPREPRFVRKIWPQTGSTKVSVVIPAMNEERNIGWVLERLPADIDDVVLVDGDSVDDTVAVSRGVRPDIRVIGQDRPGKGAALRAGFAAARGEVIVMIDADRSMDPVEIPRFLELVAEGYDLVKGSRFLTDGGTADMERVRRCGNAVLRGLANGLYRTRFTDLCYGFVAFRREVLATLALQADGFEIETEIIVRAVKSGVRVAEVASYEAPRAYGESNLNTWSDGSRVLRTMLLHRFARRRLVPEPDIEPAAGIVEPAAGIVEPAAGIEIAAA